jgi:hypothetical protein
MRERHNHRKETKGSKNQTRKWNRGKLIENYIPNLKIKGLDRVFTLAHQFILQPYLLRLRCRMALKNNRQARARRLDGGLQQ